MIEIVQRRIALLERTVKRLVANSDQAEVAGAVKRCAHAELPAAGKASRLRFVTDSLSGVVYQDTGTLWRAVYSAPIFTVATLPVTADIVAGTWAYASDGRKPGEGAGSGTGMMAFFDGSQWRSFADGATIAA